MTDKKYISKSYDQILIHIRIRTNLCHEIRIRRMWIILSFVTTLYKSSTLRSAAITLCQVCYYLPSRRASPPLDRYQVILLGDRGTL